MNTENLTPYQKSKLLKELKEHPLVSQVETLRGSSSIWVSLNQGIYRKGKKNPNAYSRYPDGAYNRVLFDDTLSAFDFLGNHVTTVKETYDALVAQEAAEELARKKAAERERRKGYGMNLKNEELPLLFPGIIGSDSYLRAPGSTSLPSLVKGTTMGVLADMDTTDLASKWQTLALESIKEKINKLLDLQTQVASMDIKAYQKDLEEIKKAANNFLDKEDT